MNTRFGVFSLLLLFAMAAGLQIAFADLHNEDVQAAVLKVLIVTFLLGCASPRHAVLWALVVGLCIPAVEFVAAAKGWKTAYPLNPPTSLIALIPAFIGAYAGVLARTFMNHGPHGPAHGLGG